MTNPTDRACVDVPAQEVALGRRGALAYAVTLAGAALAWLTGSRNAEASHLPGTGTPNADSAALHVSQVNPGTERTFLRWDAASSTPYVSFNGASPFSIGLGDGMQGISTKTGAAAGVRGRSQGASGVGVSGESNAGGAGMCGSVGTSFITPPAGTGVFGIARNVTGGMGVRGQIPADTAASFTVGVYGENFSSYEGGAPGDGGFGCYGYSLKGHGLVGATGTAGGGAVIGSTNGVAGAYAGIFYGPLVVTGAKNAAVRHPDGTHRLLYCLESPESWFEDFGNAQLIGGCAQVNIDGEFAAVSDMSEYHVFLTPYGDTKGLHVAERTPSGFSVAENDRGRSDIAFSWRVVAKRKDLDVARMARVNLPAEPRPQVTPMPPQTPERLIPAPRKATHTHR